MTGVEFTPRDEADVPLWPSVIPVQAIEPATSARVWVDTSTTPPKVKGWNGTTWVELGGSGSLDLEAVDDRVAALIVAGANITETYDDAAGTLTLSASAPGALMATLPAVGKWAADPLITSSQGPGDLWYLDSYFHVGATGYNIDRISVNVTKANAANPTLTVTAYPVTATGTVNTAAPIAGASGSYNVGTTGQKDLTVTAALPAGGVCFRFSGAAATNATGLTSKRRLGIGTNIGSSPSFGSEPYPADANVGLSYWEPTVYVRRSA